MTTTDLLSTLRSGLYYAAQTESFALALQRQALRDGFHKLAAVHEKSAMEAGQVADAIRLAIHKIEVEQA